MYSVVYNDKMLGKVWKFNNRGLVKNIIGCLLVIRVVRELYDENV